MLAVPTMLAMLLATGTGNADLTSLRVVGSFGAAMSEDRVRATLDLFGGGSRRPGQGDTPCPRGGARFVNGYGCSDGALCMTGWDDPPDKIARTVGRPSPAMSQIRTGEIASRTGPPKGSRPTLPSVHRPKVNLCSGRGVYFWLDMIKKSPFAELRPARVRPTPAAIYPAAPRWSNYARENLRLSLNVGCVKPLGQATCLSWVKPSPGMCSVHAGA